MSQTVTPMTDNPLLTPSRHPEDPDVALRPKTLAVSRAVEELGDMAGLDALVRTALKRTAG